MRQIAAAAEVTKPMVYYYFGSKESLHQRMVDGAIAAVRACLNGAITPPGSCRAKLIRLAEAHCQLSPVVLELAGTREALYSETVAAVLAEGELCREIRSVDPYLFTATFCGGLGADPSGLVDILWHGLTHTT